MEVSAITDSELYLDHANRFWNAEERNADRLHARRQLLIGISLPLLGILTAFASRSTVRAESVLDTTVVFGWTLISLLSCVIVFAAKSVFGRRPFWPIVAVGRFVPLLGFEIGILSLGLADQMSNAYVYNSSFGYGLGIGSACLGALLISIIKLLNPPETTVLLTSQSQFRAASKYFLFNESRLRTIEATLSEHELAVFQRLYRSSVELLQKNAQMDQRVREGRKWLVYATLLLTSLPIFIIQAELAAVPIRIIERVKETNANGREATSAQSDQQPQSER